MPAALFRLTAVPVVVKTDTCARSMPVRPPEPVRPVEVPVESVRPRSFAELASVTVPVRVERPLPSVGRATVPAGGLISNTESKVVPVVPCPISFSPVLRASAPV